MLVTFWFFFLASSSMSVSFAKCGPKNWLKWPVRPVQLVQDKLAFCGLVSVLLLVTVAFSFLEAASPARSQHGQLRNHCLPSLPGQVPPYWVYTA